MPPSPIFCSNLYGPIRLPAVSATLSASGTLGAIVVESPPRTGCSNKLPAAVCRLQQVLDGLPQRFIAAAGLVEKLLSLGCRCEFQGVEKQIVRFGIPVGHAGTLDYYTTCQPAQES